MCVFRLYVCKVDKDSHNIWSRRRSCDDESQYLRVYWFDLGIYRSNDTTRNSLPMFEGWVSREEAKE